MGGQDSLGVEVVEIKINGPKQRRSFLVAQGKYLPLCEKGSAWFNIRLYV